MLKKITFTLLLLLALLAPAAAAFAAYTGPGNRTISTGDCSVVLYRCEYIAAKDDYRWHQVRDWACSNESAPWNAYDKLDGQPCNSFYDGDQAWSRQDNSTSVTYPPVSVSHTINCATPGNASWCRGGLNLSLSATETMPGQVVQYFETASGALCNPADAANVNCTAPITLEGTQTASYWAVSSFGDTSLAQSYSWKLDSQAPSLISSSPSPNGANGWYISDLSVSLSGTDATSGIDAASYRYQVNGGAWQTGSLLNLTNDGVYNLNVEGRDLAGNTGTQSVTLRLDKTAPILTTSIPGPFSYKNGYYSSNVNVVASTSDAVSGIAATEYRVDGGAWQTGASAPLSAEGEHTVTYRSTNNAGLVTVSPDTVVKIDKTFPSVTFFNVTLGAPHFAPQWSRVPISVRIDAADSYSGVDTVEWGSPYVAIPNNTVLTFSTDGIHSVPVRARDIAGLSRVIGTYVQVDQTPPIQSLAAAGTTGNNGYYTSAVTISATASDATSGVDFTRYKVNGEYYWHTANSVTLSADGSYTVDFETQDVAHNATPGQVTFSIDRTPPNVIQNVPAPGGANGWHVSDIPVSLMANDATSGVAPGTLAYRVNGGTWQSGDSLNLVTEGANSIDIRATDRAGNTRSVNFSAPLDKTAPALSLSAPGVWLNASGTVSANASDATSGLAGVEYRIGSGAWQSGDHLTLDTEGIHSIEFRAFDQAGLMTSRNATLRVDLTAPTVSHSLPSPDGLNGWFVSNPTIPLSALDTLSGVLPDSMEYRVGSLDWTAGESVTVGEDGYHIVEARASDLAGNSGSAAFDLRVDTTAPQIAISVAATAPVQNGWHTGPATASANASDATSGLAKVEYQVQATAARAGRFKIVRPSWVDGSSLNLGDGDHTVTMRATDQAGNQRETSQQIRIDSAAPISSFAAVSGPVSGIVTISGPSTDATSGIAQVEVSLDDGNTWQPATYADGTWSFPYDTTQKPDGEYSILVRATDQAGNVETPVSQLVTVNNAPPKVLVQDWWWIWESGQLEVKAGETPLGSIRLEISCGIVLEYSDPDKLPERLTWDRRCGDGSLAAPGEYQVTLRACNIYGKCASDTGTIRIPEGQVTATPTALPSQTPTATPTRPNPTPTQTQVQEIIVPPPAPPAPPVPIPERLALWLLPMAGLIGMMLAMGLNYSRDPRPQAVSRLAGLLKRIADDP